MKNLSTQQKITAGAIAAVVVIGGGYLGLSTYAASVAEERINSTLAKAGIYHSSYSWSSISASPFGGVIELEGLKVHHDVSGGRGRHFISLNADRLVLEGFNTDAFPEQASISLEQVEIPSVNIDGFERNRLKQNLDHSPLMVLANSSGRTSLVPFKLQLEWVLDGEELALDWSTEQPDLFRAEGHQLITGPLTQLRAMVTPTNLTPSMTAIGSLIGLGSQLGLREVELEIQDLGAIERANQLRARYDIAGGKAENKDQSDAAFLTQNRSGCENGLQAIFTNSDACERLAEFLSAERSSIHFSAEGERSLTLSELFQLDHRNADYLKSEFSPEIN